MSGHRRRHHRESGPYARLYDGKVLGCLYELFRGRCERCGEPIGVAVGVNESSRPVPFDAVLPPRGDFDRIAFVAHRCKEGGA